MDCVKCGEAVNLRRSEILAQWGKPVTCLTCAEDTPKYRLEAEHDAVREDAPVFVLVTAANYSYGTARLGSQKATYIGGGQ